MKLKIKSPYLMICAVLLLFTTQGFGISASEAARFKRTCIKSGGHVGYRDGNYVCAGSSVMAPSVKKNIKHIGKTRGTPCDTCGVNVPPGDTHTNCEGASKSKKSNMFKFTQLRAVEVKAIVKSNKVLPK